VSCAKRTTRPRAARTSHVRRTLQSESCRARSGRRDLAPRRSTRITRTAHRSSRAPCDGSPKGPHHRSSPPHRTAIVKRRASYAELTTRGGSGQARSSPAPYARGSCHARELVTRAATSQESEAQSPEEIEGHREHAERDAAREALRIRRRRARASARNLRGFRGTCPVRRARVQAAKSQARPIDGPPRRSRNSTDTHAQTRSAAPNERPTFTLLHRSTHRPFTNDPHKGATSGGSPCSDS